MMNSCKVLVLNLLTDDEMMLSIDKMSVVNWLETFDNISSAMLFIRSAISSFFFSNVSSCNIILFV